MLCAHKWIRQVGGVLRMPGILLCTAALALSLPTRPAVERDCVTANLQARAAGCMVSDLDGDRKADYAFSLDFSALSVHRASISIHLSSAPGVHQLLLPDGLPALSFILRDVDGDGNPDIALLGSFDETVGVFLNDGLGGFRFDLRDRYLTPPNHDLSGIAPSPHAFACDCAEPGLGSYCAIFAQAGVARELPAANIRLPRNLSSPARRPFNSARSRAP